MEVSEFIMLTSVNVDLHLDAAKDWIVWCLLRVISFHWLENMVSELHP
jgi:hypothetical protein